ncbi:MAG: hypothetical protein PHW76_08500 [Alphaproteobacteria bacterium]|nr:hypothetical protein [Alphaproteobacteria bacterium]
MTEAQATTYSSNNLEEIRAAKEAFYKDNLDFVSAFPETMRPLLADFGLGQAATEDAYTRYEEKHGDTLTTGQHPHYAVIGSSHYLCHPSNIIGLPDDAVGDALVLRTAGGSTMNSEGEMNFEAALYLPLATKLKKIETVFQAKTDADELLNLVYQYQKNGRKWDALPEDIRNNKYIQDFVKERWPVFKTVEAVGIEHYEDLLLKGISDEKTRKELTTDLSDEARFVRAMSIQMLLWERELFVTDEFKAENTVSVFQAVGGKREFVWSDRKNAFVIIPEADENDSSFQKQQMDFFDALPESLTHLEHGHPAIGDLLMRGAREYKKVLESVSNVRDALDFFIVACSDSRSATISVAGPLANNVRYPQRNPGAFLSLNEKLTNAAGRFIALAKLHKKPLVMAYHTNCGAMEAVDDCLGKKGTVPGAFNELSENRSEMYETVKANGVDYYREKYGIPVTNIADCMPIEQAIQDYEVVRKEAKELDVYVIIQNMREPRNYLLNPDTKKFVAIPTANWSGGPKPPTQRRAQNHFHCNCGSGH